MVLTEQYKEAPVTCAAQGCGNVFVVRRQRRDGRAAFCSSACRLRQWRRGGDSLVQKKVAAAVAAKFAGNGKAAGKPCRRETLTARPASVALDCLGKHGKEHKNGARGAPVSDLKTAGKGGIRAFLPRKRGQVWGIPPAGGHWWLLQDSGSCYFFVGDPFGGPVCPVCLKSLRVAVPRRWTGAYGWRACSERCAAAFDNWYHDHDSAGLHLPVEGKSYALYFSAGVSCCSGCNAKMKARPYYNHDGLERYCSLSCAVGQADYLCYALEHLRAKFGRDAWLGRDCLVLVDGAWKGYTVEGLRACKPETLTKEAAAGDVVGGFAEMEGCDIPAPAPKRGRRSGQVRELRL